MKLKCEINNKTYDIVNGAVFSEEYNETLDSGSIIITGVERQPELRPFDDVYIYDADSDFRGYTSRKSEFIEVHTESVGAYIRINKEELLSVYKNRTFERGSLNLVFYINNSRQQSNLCKLRYHSETDDFDISFINPTNWVPLTQYETYYELFLIYLGGVTGYFEYFTFKVTANDITMPNFYRHLLIDTFTEEKLNPVKNIFKYKIELFSETKKLERIPIPNISITQPLDISLRKSVADYIRQYVSMYSPRIKVATSNDTFMYLNKYEIDDSIDEIFGDVYCPDFSLDNPNLRTLLNQLFLVKDRIPYVKDDVIYALDITERKGNFSLSNLNNVTGSRSSENHATSLKRNYKDALSGRNTARKVEYIGFRNSNNALLTIDNMRVETKFPIYRINKFYLCYYKKAQIWSGVGENAYYTGEDKVFLCKQDITKLIKLAEEEATLSKDWNDFTQNPPNNIDEMAQYKLCTLTYSIGSNIIDGWGTSYEYPMGWWGDNTVTKTYIENVFNLLETFTPYGIYKVGYLNKSLKPNQFITINQSATHKLDNLVSPIPISDGAKRLKSFFFMVDYEAFCNGTTFTSKDNEDRDDIVTNDNQSSSLTLLEKDGLFQKEKANRFGNMAFSYYGTYDNISELQELGSVDNSLDDDVIIYHREYQIFENYVKASYFGSKDYVLKNYFTSVYAKHRPFNLLSYNQSIIRAENRKVFLMLSKEKSYYEMINSDYNLLPPIKFNGFSSYLDVLLSFAIPNPTPETIDRFSFPNKINYGYITYDNKKYANDINIFTNGYSLCMNISMWDNISMGNYIKVLSPQNINQAVEEDFTGSVQSYYPIIDNVKTGFTQTMGFYFSHTPEESFSDIVIDYENGIETTLYDKLLKLPLLENSLKQSNVIGQEYEINKDNKEVIDMTFQIEPYTNDKNVMFSEWLLKLCGLYGVYTKFSNNQVVTEIEGYITSIYVYCGTCFYLIGDTDYRYRPMLMIKFSNTLYNSLSDGTPISFNYAWNYSHYDITKQFPWDWVVIGLDVTFTEIVTKTADTITFKAKCVKTVKRGMFDAYPEQQPFETTYTLRKVSKIASIDFSSDTSNYYFSNIESGGGVFLDHCFESGWYGDNNANITLGTDAWTNSNHSEIEMQIGRTGGVSKTYYRNMFVRLNDDELKKTLVYDEFKDGEINDFQLRPIEDFISIDHEQATSQYQEQEKAFVKIDLTYVSNTKKSIELWYSDREDLSITTNGTLHFVFGVNLTDEDFERGYVKIYASLLTKKDTRVFGVNNKVIGEITNYEDSNKKYGEKQYYVLK